MSAPERDDLGKLRRGKEECFFLFEMEALSMFDYVGKEQLGSKRLKIEREKLPERSKSLRKWKDRIQDRAEDQY